MAEDFIFNENLLSDDFLSENDMYEKSDIQENNDGVLEIQLTRSEQREQAFMFLFSKSFDNVPIEDAIVDNSQLYMGGLSAYAQTVVADIETKANEIDEIISKYLKKGWTILRISKPSLAILRLAIYEINYLENVSASVATNEAVELAKKYCIGESGFINGILGSYIRDIKAK